MKKPASDVAQYIRWMRYIRPLIDCGLLLVGLFFWMYLNQLSRKNDPVPLKSNRAMHTLHQPLKNQPSKRDTISVVQEFPSESDLWIALGTWFNNHPGSTGNCRIQSGNEEETPYSLQCIGSIQHANHKQQATGKHLPEPTTALTTLNVLSAPKPSKKRARTNNTEHDIKQTPPATESTNYAVSGWINTPKGRRHFDPVLNRWVP